MSVPAFGAIFIPIALWIFFCRPRYLVPLMVVASVFAAASVLDISVGDSDFGVQPYYFAAGLLAIRALPVLLRYRSLERRMEPAVGKITGSLMGFWKWAIVSAFLFPVIFKGLQVIDPRSEVTDIVAALDIGSAVTSLHWGLGNLVQAAYLTLNVVALLYVFASKQNVDRSRQSMGALRAAITIVSLIALFQAIAAWGGWSFPYLFFNSNPGYAQNYSAAFESVSRVNSTFTEASYAGGVLAAGALGLLARRLSDGRGGWLAILLAVVGLILTTATTGYAAFFVGGVLMFIYFTGGSLRKKLSRRVLIRCVSALSLVVAAVIVLLVADPPLREAAIEMTFNKVGTVSLAARTSLDAYSIKLLFNTYGLGAGLGSTRPSSLGADLLGNVGLIGTLFFVVYVARLFAQLLAKSRSRRKDGGLFAMVAWMLAGLVIAQTLAIPDLNWPPLWAVLIAAACLLVSRAEPTKASMEGVAHAAPQGLPPAVTAVI